jgi:hypothetical protein
MAVVGLILIFISYIPYQSTKYHNVLLIIGAFLIGLSVDSVLKRIKRKVR